MLIYVDDIVVTRHNDQFIQWLIDSLGWEFAIKNLGCLHYFLGLEVQYTHTGLILSQGKYAKDIMAKVGKKANSHFNISMALKAQSNDKDNMSFDVKTYRSLAGALLYLTYTRPDIVHVIHEVCQKIQQLTIRDYKAIKRIIRYIKTIINFELHYIQ